ncbi:MAG: hypothetical protein U0525_03485 [Patescibacteria group bacterium]
MKKSLYFLSNLTSKFAIAYLRYLVIIFGIATLFGNILSLKAEKGILPLLISGSSIIASIIFLFPINLIKSRKWRNVFFYGLFLPTSILNICLFFLASISAPVFISTANSLTQAQYREIYLPLIANIFAVFYFFKYKNGEIAWSPFFTGKASFLNYILIPVLFVFTFFFGIFIAGIKQNGLISGNPMEDVLVALPIKKVVFTNEIQNSKFNVASETMGRDDSTNCIYITQKDKSPTISEFYDNEKIFAKIDRSQSPYKVWIINQDGSSLESTRINPEDFLETEIYKDIDGVFQKIDWRESRQDHSTTISIVRPKIGLVGTYEDQKKLVTGDGLVVNYCKYFPFPENASKTSDPSLDKPRSTSKVKWNIQVLDGGERIQVVDHIKMVYQTDK